MVAEPRAEGEKRQGRVRQALGAADLVSLARVPLAALFVLSAREEVRLPVLAVVAASDLLDGWLARRLGPSRIGAVLDPITDKLFMVAAFVMLALSGALTPLEVAGVLVRDIVAPIGYFLSFLLKRPFKTIPARAGGKLVTVGQSITLFAWLIGSRYLEPVAWATAAMGFYALADYGLTAARRAHLWGGQS